MCLSADYCNGVDDAMRMEAGENERKICSLHDCTIFDDE